MSPRCVDNLEQAVARWQSALQSEKTAALAHTGRVFLTSPRVLACLRDAFKQRSGAYDDTDDARSEIWLVLQGKCLAELSAPDKVYPLVYAIATNLAARSATSRYRSELNVSLNAADGHAAESEDFAAVGEHIAPTMIEEHDSSLERLETTLVNNPAREAFLLKLQRLGRPAVRAPTSLSPPPQTRKAERARRSTPKSKPTGIEFKSDLLMQRLTELSVALGVPRAKLNDYLSLAPTIWNSIARGRLRWEDLSNADRDAIDTALKVRQTVHNATTIKAVRTSSVVALRITWAGMLGHVSLTRQARSDIAACIGRSVASLHAWGKKRPAEWLLVAAHRRMLDCSARANVHAKDMAG